jgi:membrane protease YdiL (CAAX protease family)
MSPVALARRFPLTSFVVLACLFGWSFFIVDFLTGGTGAENLPIGPFFAVLVVVACQGRTELRAWGRQLRSWRAPPRWYAVSVLAPLAMVVLIVVANHAFGAPLPTPDQLGQWPQVPVDFLVMLVLVGIGEEVGWTAFAAPILLRRHGLLLAWVVAAGIRIFWHLPMMITGSLSWTLGLLGNAAFTMVTLLVLIASGGRWSLVAVWHATLNAASGLFVFAMVTGADRARLGWLMALSYTVLAAVWYVAGGRHLKMPTPPASPATSEPVLVGAAVRRPTPGGTDVR